MDQVARSRWSRRQFLGASLTTLAGLAAYGCAPASPASPGSAAPAGGIGATAVPARPGAKMVSLATGNGIFNGLPDVNGTSNSLNRPEVWGIGHSALSLLNHEAQPVP